MTNIDLQITNINDNLNKFSLYSRTDIIKAFGALGYSPERIVNILNLKGSEREEIISRIRTAGDSYNSAYLHGNAVGEYNIDAELAKQAEKGDIDSVESLGTRKKERTHLDLKRKLFGI